MAKPNSWADISNNDIALIRQARGAPLPANFLQTSPYMNLTRDDVEYIARLRGREYNPKFGPSNNLRGDDLAFIQNLKPNGQPILTQQFSNSGSPYVGGALSPLPTAASPVPDQGVLSAVPTVIGSGQVSPDVPNKALQDRLNGSRRNKPMAGLDPSLPSYQPQGPVDYATLNANQPVGVYPLTATVASNAPVPEQQSGLKLFQKNVRSALGLPPIPDNRGVLSTPQVGTPTANAVPSQPVLDPMIDTRAMENGYGVPLAAMDTRGSENGYGVPLGSMDTRASENGYGSAPKAATRNASASASTPTADTGSAGTAALFYLDDGSGALRPFLSKDGSAPNIPGVTAIRDDTYNPNAGALARFIRGVF